MASGQEVAQILISAAAEADSGLPLGWGVRISRSRKVPRYVSVTKVRSKPPDGTDIEKLELFEASLSLRALDSGLPQDWRISSFKRNAVLFYYKPPKFGSFAASEFRWDPPEDTDIDKLKLFLAVHYNVPVVNLAHAIHLDYEDFPLDFALEEIRLLRVYPAHTGFPLECELETYSLNNCPPYEPLSYTWGDLAAEKIPIRCNGKRLDIFPNLYAALEALRAHELPPWMGSDGVGLDQESRLVWADAICINQTDLNERKEQVLIMEKIYRQGIETLIWLGSLDYDAMKGFELLKTLVKVKTLQEANSDERNYVDLGVKGIQEYGLPNFLSSDFHSLSSFLRRPWFTRVWIIQELAVAPQATIHCGHLRMPWTEFVTAINYGAKLGIPVGNRTYLLRVYELETFRSTVAGGESKSLLNWLNISSTFCASEPMDKIYALYGLANDCGPEALDIQPDYGLELEQLYRKVAEQILQKSTNLDILNFPRPVKTTESSSSPTWIPAWNSENSTNWWTGLGHNFEAAPKNIPYSVQILGNGSLLCLSGLILDRIDEIGDIYSGEASDETSFFGVVWEASGQNVLLNKWEKIVGARSNTTYRNTSEAILDAYWQTITLGFAPNGYAEAKHSFNEWDKLVRWSFRILPTSERLQWALPTLKFLAIVAMCVNKLANGGSWAFAKSFQERMMGTEKRRIFRTKKGYIGLAPATAQKDDSIAIIKGSRLPLSLRASSGGREWALIGACYVHGVMSGEGFKEDDCLDLQIC